MRYATVQKSRPIGRPKEYKLSLKSKAQIANSKCNQTHSQSTKNKISNSLFTYFWKKNNNLLGIKLDQNQQKDLDTYLTFKNVFANNTVNILYNGGVIMILKEMILSVIEDWDSAKQITIKLIRKYPNHLIRKTEYYNDGKRALSQIEAEIGSIMIEDKDLFEGIKKDKYKRYRVRHKTFAPKSEPVADEMVLFTSDKLENENAILNKENELLYEKNKQLNKVIEKYQLRKEKKAKTSLIKSFCRNLWKKVLG